MAAELLEHLREQFLRLEQTSSEPSELLQQRRRALEALLQRGFPTTRHEDWKYTSLAPVLRYRYEVGAPASEELPSLSMVQGLPQPQLWLLDGVPHVHELPAGVELRTAERFALNGARREPLPGQLVDVEGDAFVALNTAFAPVPLTLTMRESLPIPMHIGIVTQADAAPRLGQPRLLMSVASGTSAALIFSFAHHGANPSLTNAVFELLLQPNAALDVLLWQDGLADAFAVTTLAARLESGARLRVWTLSFSGALVRNNVYIRLAGGAADAQLYGVTMATGQRLVDHHTRVEHEAEGCSSNQLYKSLAQERATVNFTGRIYVHPGAQRTNAYQAHRALLLSTQATVNARPQLEIYADDVRCTHGAAVGNLDEQALFYLRSRGIPEAQARKLLLYAFVREPLEALPSDALRELAERSLAEHIQLPIEEFA